MNRRTNFLTLPVLLAFLTSPLLAVPPLPEPHAAPTPAPMPLVTPDTAIAQSSPTPSPRPARTPSPRVIVDRFTQAASSLGRVLPDRPTPKPIPKATPKPTPRRTYWWPVVSARDYVSQRFHGGHYGMDIAAPSGSRIVPIRSGRTVFAGWRNNDGGYQVWVSHGRGLYSAYYHMSRETSYSGEPVTGGSETIGNVGATGHATGPHLHLEVWVGFPWRTGSRRVNPAKYLP